MRSSLRYLVILSALLGAAGCNRQHYTPPPYVVDETFVHRYGVAIDPDDWQNRGSDGQIISTLKNGVTVTKSYSMGELDGETTYSFPHSENIQITEIYSKGNLVSQKTHYKTGAPQQEVIVYSPTERTVTTWYETGTPQSTERYENGLVFEGKYYNPAYEQEGTVQNGEGLRINRDGYGQLIGKDTIAAGQCTITQIYYPNGAVKEVFNYTGGEIDGEKRTFSPSGEPLTVENWKNGVQDGITNFYENGEKVSECPYAAGIKSGVEKRYTQNGNALVEEVTWKNDQRTGPTYIYVGDTKTTFWYYKNRQVGKAEYDRLVKFS